MPLHHDRSTAFEATGIVAGSIGVCFNTCKLHMHACRATSHTLHHAMVCTAALQLLLLLLAATAVPSKHEQPQAALQPNKPQPKEQSQIRMHAQHACASHWHAKQDVAPTKTCSGCSWCMPVGGVAPTLHRLQRARCRLAVQPSVSSPLSSSLS